ncbi:MAG: 50S ribosomal protein L30 [Halobacteriales archaeon]
MSSLGLVQVRGEAGQSGEVRDTLDMLNLGALNRFTVVPDDDSYRGMVYKVNDYVAYGEPGASTVALLLRRRGETAGGEDVTDDYVADETEYADVDALAEAVVEGETTLRDAGVSPTLRLHPPRKGHAGIKKSASQGGVLGYHGDEIDDLLRRMR